jgi:hypothetical protein
MTGPDHYREAERLLAMAQGKAGWTGEPPEKVIGLAQVHATLAAAAGGATAWNAVLHPRSGDDPGTGHSTCRPSKPMPGDGQPSAKRYPGPRPTGRTLSGQRAHTPHIGPDVGQ